MGPEVVKNEMIYIEVTEGIHHRPLGRCWYRTQAAEKRT
jgi:hypothetical protein